MRYVPRPGHYIRRHDNSAGDPLEGLVNLFDLSLVLAVGFLLAGFSAIGATDLLTSNRGGTPLQGAPSTAGTNQNGQGKEVGKVYQLANGTYVFQSSGSGLTGGATSATGSTAPTGSTTPTGSSIPPTSSSGATIPPASGATSPTGTSLRQ